MLIELTIENLAIIDRVHLTFAPGFTVLTGETGAGKSIIVDALGAVLGGRTGSELVRAGREAARVEAIFTLPEDGRELRALLAEHGVDPGEDLLILSREILRAGRTICRIGGRAVPQYLLRQVGEALVDIHGQTDHLSLLRPAEHVNALDRFGDLLGLRREVARLCGQLRGVRHQIQAIEQDERELARRMDLLRFQRDEIAAARLLPGEEAELEQEQRLLANAERRASLAGAAYDLLQEAVGPRRSSLLDGLGELATTLGELAELDPGQRSPAEQAETVSYQLEDLARSLRLYRDSVEFNPERLAEIEERLELIRNLKRKYGRTIEEVLAYGAGVSRDLENIERREERQAELAEAEERLAHELGRLAGQLSAERQKVAERLAQAIVAELADLHMAKVRFSVAVEQVEAADGVPLPDRPGRFAVSETGADRVAFLIAPNPGEPLKPLARIASGGETSRLTLAMQAVLGRAGAVPTLVFDEVDVGIGGRSGQIVGSKLWEVAREHQVICITHLPQTAAHGDAQFSIAKRTDEQRTWTEVRPLSEAERLEELASMLGGATAATRRSAEEMLQHAAARRGQGDAETRGHGAGETRGNGSGPRP